MEPDPGSWWDLWNAGVGAGLGSSVGLAVSKAFLGIEKAGGWIPGNALISSFVGLMFALAFWTLAFRKAS